MKFLPSRGEKPQGSMVPAILVGVFVSIGGILFGYDTATISGILDMNYWIKTMATTTNASGQPIITTGQTSLTVSILSVGTFIGMEHSVPIGYVFAANSQRCTAGGPCRRFPWSSMGSCHVLLCIHCRSCASNSCVETFSFHRRKSRCRPWCRSCIRSWYVRQCQYAMNGICM